MGNFLIARPRGSFRLPLMSVLAIGTGLTIAFYGWLLYGPWDHAWLKRYCLQNSATECSIGLFCVVMAALAVKLYEVYVQQRMAQAIGLTLEKFVVAGAEVHRVQRPLWLEAHWLSLPQSTRDSWMGRRVAEIIDRQIKRGQSARLESDVRELADGDRAAQRDSYTFWRAAVWALPALGGLGAVIGISQTAEQLDTELLASQWPVALKQLAAGLLQSLDCMLLAAALTLIVVVAQSAAHRAEGELLGVMDEVVRDNLIDFLESIDFSESQARQVEQELLQPVRQMADELVGSVHNLVEQQAALWARSISESHQQWSAWATTGGDQFRVALSEALNQSLGHHAQEIERIGQESGRQVDARWQQWQITLSDQARVMHGQQKELVRQTEALERLITSTCQLKKLEEVLQESFGEVQMLEQIKQNTLELTQAVTALSTSLERAGIIRGAPVKPRVHRKLDAPEPVPQKEAA